MYIKRIHINSFGKLSDRTFLFSDGVNVIEGDNESGKSTLAMFIKFMLYGLSGRASDGDISEREKYVSWETGRASGEMSVVSRGREYFIERELFLFSEKDAVREKVSVTDTESGERVFKGLQPGAAILGMNESLFLNTVFVRQLTDAKIDGAGTAAAIENMLLTGSENLNTKKALDKLDRARVSLRHKTGAGGRINDLMREYSRLEGNLSEAEKTNAEIIALEASLGGVGDAIAAKEAEVRECTELCTAYDVLMRYRQLETARRYEKEVADADKELEKYGKYGNISKKTREIYRLSSEIASADEKLKSCRRRINELEDTLPDVMTENEKTEAESDVRYAEKNSKSSSLIGTGVVFLLLSALSVALDVTLLGETYNLPCLGAAALFLLVGALAFGIGVSRKKRLRYIMKKWGADSVSSLRRNVRTYIDGAEMRGDPNSEYGVLVSEKRTLDGERAMNIKALREICADFTEEVPDTDIFMSEALASAERAENEIKAISEKRLEASAGFGAVSSVLGSDGGAAVEQRAKEVLGTDAGKRAQGMTRQDAEKYLRRKGLAEATLPGLREQYSEKSTKLGILKKTTENPADVAARAEEVKNEAKRLGKCFDAIVCAMDAIGAAGENLRRGIIPRAAGNAQKLSGDFTNGKYSHLALTKDFGISVDDGGKMRDLRALSAGTSDIMYICLRTALMMELFPNDTPPQMFDETFARIDEKRLERVMRLLILLGDTAQSFVFTCRKLEGEICSELGDATLIRMEN